MSDQAVAPLIVIVVEDEELVRQLVAPSLEEAGYGIIEASSGDEALLILQKPESQAIRALITDVDLGGKVTGWDVAHRAREINPSVAVVYMTGAGADQWSANGVPNSILVTKPFAPAQVVTAVSQLLNTAPSAPS